MRSETQCTPATAVTIFAAQLLEEPVAAKARTGHWADDAKRALTTHWPEYLIEGICLGTFMISACAFSALLEHPASPVRAQRDERRHSPVPERAGDGHNGDSSYLFAAGTALRRAHEPSNHPDVLPAGKGRGVGRILLHAVAVHRRRIRDRAGLSSFWGRRWRIAT